MKGKGKRKGKRRKEKGKRRKEKERGKEREERKRKKERKEKKKKAHCWHLLSCYFFGGQERLFKERKECDSRARQRRQEERDRKNE